MKLNRCHRPRKGFSIVLIVLCLVMLMSVTALVVDIGYLHNARAELQRTADASALACCWKLGEEFADGNSYQTVFTAVRTTANDCAAINHVTNSGPSLDTDDVVFGHLADFDNRNEVMDTSDPSNANAVQVRVRRTNAINGPIQTFFARVMGVDGVDAQATATGVIIRDIAGFETPSDGSNLDILPFALDIDTWNDMLNGIGGDYYHWDGDNKVVSSGQTDNILEVNLYPQGTGSPGNRGTVDIGGSNNSTNDIARQIVHGISEDDMDEMGGSLEFDADGELELNGDTGISAGVKDELASIIGQTRIIPIFSQVTGPGNNADYTIVMWAGVRIMDVKLTGPMKKKHLTVQPAPIASEGIIPAAAGSSTSTYVYSKPFLVR